MFNKKPKKNIKQAIQPVNSYEIIEFPKKNLNYKIKSNNS